MAIFEVDGHHLMTEQRMLSDAFANAGVAQADVATEVLHFWNWNRNLEQPYHRIWSYIFAAVGRRVVNGQRHVNRGMMNDVRAIATYAPYVDAMFVDQGVCRHCLRSPRLPRNSTTRPASSRLETDRLSSTTSLKSRRQRHPRFASRRLEIYGIEAVA